VVRRVLDTHGLSGPYPDVPDLESATRVTPDGTRLRFLLNHAASAVTVDACASGVDLLTGASITRGEPLHLDARAVVVIREDG
jgi:beta-galactosidase